MASLGGRKNWILVFIINVFIYAQKANAALPTMKDAKDFVSTVCNDYESLPEKVCDKTVGIAQTRVDNLCRNGVQDLCKKIPWPLQILISVGKCEEELDKWLCRTIDDVAQHAKNECIEELGKFIIGHGCDANGNEVNMCDGMLTTVDGVCTMIVDTMCNELPSALEPLIPYCQEWGADIICEVVVDKIVNQENSNSFPMSSNADFLE